MSKYLILPVDLQFMLKKLPRNVSPEIEFVVNQMRMFHLMTSGSY